jgi:hypothetical protein
MLSRAQTIKDFAREYFQRVNYVDIYGRKVGYDYDFILTEIKKKFPAARTSKRWLRMMAYEITGTVQMPMRRRSRRALAEGYAEVLLLRRQGQSVDIYKNITREIKRKFPDQHVSSDELRRIEKHLKFLKFPIPPRS